MVFTQWASGRGKGSGVGQGWDEGSPRCGRSCWEGAGLPALFAVVALVLLRSLGLNGLVVFCDFHADSSELRVIGWRVDALVAPVLLLPDVIIQRHAGFLAVLVVPFEGL
jgi:hypothetical protein